MVFVSPTFTVWFGIVPTVVGARFGCTTVAVKVCVTLKLSGSVAVTVIVAVPTATPVSVNVALDMATVALVVSDEVAV